MTNDNNRPGADAPGEKKKFVRGAVERVATRAASAPATSDAHRAAASPRRRQVEAVVDPALDGGASGTDADRLAARYGRRQVEAVVDPRIDDTSAQFKAKSLIAVLPPEAVVRLVLAAGRLAKKQGKPLPPNIAQRLSGALARGDATAPLLRDWATRIGVLAETPGGSYASADDDGLAQPGRVHSSGPAHVAEHDRATIRAVMLARHLRERLGMSRPALRAQARRKTSLGSPPATSSDSGDASPTVSDDPGRRS